MPEAAVDKDACAVPPQNDVRLSRQTWVVESVSETARPQKFAHKKLRLRVFGTNGSHIPVALFCGQSVGHRLFLVQYFRECEEIRVILCFYVGQFYLWHDGDGVLYICDVEYEEEIAVGGFESHVHERLLRYDAGTFLVQQIQFSVGIACVVQQQISCPLKAGTKMQ